VPQAINWHKNNVNSNGIIIKKKTTTTTKSNTNSSHYKCNLKQAPDMTKGQCTTYSSIPFINKRIILGILPKF
jgi:hypothetical protein